MPGRVLHHQVRSPPFNPQKPITWVLTASEKPETEIKQRGNRNLFLPDQPVPHPRQRRGLHYHPPPAVSSQEPALPFLPFLAGLQTAERLHLPSLLLFPLLPSPLSPPSLRAVKWKTISSVLSQLQVAKALGSGLPPPPLQTLSGNLAKPLRQTLALFRPSQGLLGRSAEKSPPSALASPLALTSVP